MFFIALLFRHGIVRQYYARLYRFQLDGFYDGASKDRDGWILFDLSREAWHRADRKSMVAAIKAGLESQQPDRRCRALSSLLGLSEEREFRFLFRDETPQFVIDPLERTIFLQQVREHFPDRIPVSAHKNQR